MAAGAGAVVAAFLSAVADHDLDRAFALVADDADVRLPAAGVNGAPPRHAGPCTPPSPRSRTSRYGPGAPSWPGTAPSSSS
ncbi:hypothetical protein ACFQV8_30425 [Pseudonocardia benzenivorans]